MATGIGIGVIYGLETTEFLETGQEKTQIEANFYAGFHRFFWAVALSWIVFSCSKGYGGFVNRFLSWEVFLPLSRLSYTSYLLHGTVIFLCFANFRFAMHFTHIWIVSL